MPRKTPAASRSPAADRIIRTKLGPPRAPRHVVPREAVQATLALGLERTLTVLRAPAGFGKSTVLAGWRERLLADRRIVAWVTLDADDNDPNPFVAYLTHALSGALGSLGDHVPELATSAESASPKVRLTSLINALDSIDAPVVLILDDYDRIVAPAIHDLLSFLVLHAPSTLHVVIATRSEPPLPLAWLRAHDELVEIDAGGLRFGYEDTRRFLGEAAIGLDTHQLRALHEATEGWVAGLQIAAMALRERGDPARLIAGFSGKFRAINEYLADTVLPSLDEATVRLLLRTSILERFNGELCEVVAGGEAGGARLSQLYQQNLFLQALDDENGWFRYHALFGDFLRSELQRRLPKEVRKLHERAANWFARHELWSEAVRHALAAGRIELAADWVERCAMREVEDSRVHDLLAWVDKLPAEAQRGRLRLRIAVAWALLLIIRIDEAMAVVDDIAAQVGKAGGAKGAAIETELLALRFCITALKDDTAAALPLGERCLKRLQSARPGEEPSTWVVQAFLNGLTHCYQKAGRVDEARAMQRPERYPLAADSARNLFTQCYRASTLGACDIREARLHEGARQMREAMRRAEAHAGRRCAAATLVACSLAAVHYEWNEIDTADELLADRLDIVDDACYLDSVRSAYLVLARISAVRGDYESAHAVLDRAEVVASRRRWARLAAICEAERVRLWLLQERPLEAEAALLRLERATPATAPRQPSVASETWRVRGIARARWQLHRGDAASAATLLQAVLDDEHPASSPYPCVRTRTLLAVALHRSGHIDAAFDQVDALFALGEASGLLRSIVDEGAAFVPVLADHAAKRPADRSSTWRGSLFAVLGLHEAAPIAATRKPAPQLIEPLSNRERDVLTLVAQGHSNEQTARALKLGLETVKWHLKNVYGKLGVSRRTLAVHRARQLDLIRDPEK